MRGWRNNYSRIKMVVRYMALDARIVVGIGLVPTRILIGFVMAHQLVVAGLANQLKRRRITAPR